MGFAWMRDNYIHVSNKKIMLKRPIGPVIAMAEHSIDDKKWPEQSELLKFTGQKRDLITSK